MIDIREVNMLSTTGTLLLDVVDEVIFRTDDVRVAEGAECLPFSDRREEGGGGGGDGGRRRGWRRRRRTEERVYLCYPENPLWLVIPPSKLLLHLLLLPHNLSMGFDG